MHDFHVRGFFRCDAFRPASYNEFELLTASKGAGASCRRSRTVSTFAAFPAATLFVPTVELRRECYLQGRRMWPQASSNPPTLRGVWGGVGEIRVVDRGLREYRGAGAGGWVVGLRRHAAAGEIVVFTKGG